MPRYHRSNVMLARGSDDVARPLRCLRRSRSNNSPDPDVLAQRRASERIVAAEDSVKFLKALLDVARALVEAGKEQIAVILPMMVGC